MQGSIFSVVTKVLRYKGWAAHRFSYAVRHNETNSAAPPVVKNYYLNFWTCLTVDIARDRSKTLKNEEEKRKMRRSQATAPYFYFFI